MLGPQGFDDYTKIDGLQYILLILSCVVVLYVLLHNTMLNGLSHNKIYCINIVMFLLSL